MNLLDPTFVRDACDYSFGDQSSIVHRLWNGYTKEANDGNIEFIKKYNEIKKTRKVMTLFIDNIRLYNREGIKYTATEQIDENTRLYKDKIVKYLKNNDLLQLCAQLSDMKFIIFTGFEDTPIDEFIFDKIPDNVLKIYASNAIAFGKKIKPIPYGLQRKLNPFDFRHQIINKIKDTDQDPKNLLYINHNFKTNPERASVNNFFSDKPWATIESGLSYPNYLESIKNHKFMICPSGNAIGCDCHRDWEVLYMRRVPIVKKSEYLEYIFRDFPVLFVNNFSDVTPSLLEDNDHLFQIAQNLDFKKLDYEILYKEYVSEALNDTK